MQYILDEFANRRCDAYVHSIHCMSMQLQLSNTFLPSCRSLLCLGLHSCNQSKRGHSQQRNMLKNKQHDAGICCRNAGDVAAAVAAVAVGQSTTAIRNQSKCQRAKQTSRTDTNTHTHTCMQIVCVHGHHTSNHVPKIFNLFSLKRFAVAASALCRALALWFPSRCYCFCNGQRK